MEGETLQGCRRRPVGAPQSEPNELNTVINAT